MSDSDAIDLESVADTQQDSGDRSVSTGKKVSSLYSLWRCEPAEFRDATHRGAHCLLCKAHQEERGQPVDPKRHCLADQPSILAHIKNCPHQQKSDRARAEVELAAYRARKRKRPDSSSDPSSKSAPLSKYMAHQDKPFTAEGQKAFEQQCLKATVSANLPMSAWDDQKLFLVAYVLHPARQLKHINKHLGFAYSSSIVNYAVSFHKRFFPDCTAADSKQLFQDTAKYLGNKGAFGNAIPNYQDAKADPEDFWDLMKQSAPQLSRLARHLFQIPVNSAAVERLFSAFGNIHTKRRNRFVHDRVHSIALIKSMLPPKPRSAKQAEGSQYLGTHVRPTRSTVNEETAAAE